MARNTPLATLGILSQANGYEGDVSVGSEVDKYRKSSLFLPTLVLVVMPMPREAGFFIRTLIDWRILCTRISRYCGTKNKEPPPAT